MAESFLEAQLQRIRALSERMSQVQMYAEQWRRDFLEDAPGNPLYAARDYRLLSSLDDESRESTTSPAPTEPPRRRRRRPR